MTNCSKFHQVRIKTKGVMEGGRIRPPPGLRGLNKAWTGSKPQQKNKSRVCSAPRPLSKCSYPTYLCGIIVKYYKRLEGIRVKSGENA